MWFEAHASDKLRACVLLLGVWATPARLGSAAVRSKEAECVTSIAQFVVLLQGLRACLIPYGRWCAFVAAANGG